MDRLMDRCTDRPSHDILLLCHLAADVLLHVVAGRVQEEAQNVRGCQDGPRADQHTIDEVEEGAVPGRATGWGAVHPTPTGSGNLVDWRGRGRRGREREG